MKLLKIVSKHLNRVKCKIGLCFGSKCSYNEELNENNLEEVESIDSHDRTEEWVKDMNK